MKFLNFIRNQFRKKETKEPKLNNIFKANEKLKTELKALEKIEKDLKSI